MRTTIFTVLYFLMYLIDHYEKFHDKKGSIPIPVDITNCS